MPNIFSSNPSSSAFFTVFQLGESLSTRLDDVYGWVESILDQLFVIQNHLEQEKMTYLFKASLFSNLMQNNQKLKNDFSSLNEQYLNVTSSIKDLQDSFCINKFPDFHSLCVNQINLVTSRYNLVKSHYKTLDQISAQVVLTMRQELYCV